MPDEVFPSGETQVTARELTVAGERVRVVESGPPDGFPVVLLHGWGASAYNFRGVLATLGRSGLRVIAPDLRGHGWSETALPPGAWSPRAMTEWVRNLLDHLVVDRCVLVGQSIGGAIVMDAAVSMPGRVAGLVLLTPIGFTPVRRVLLARLLHAWRPASTPRWLVAVVMRRIHGTRGRWTDRDVDEYWVPLQRGGVVAALLQSAREFDFTPRDVSRLSLGDCRVVIRFGELDRLIPSRLALRHAQGIQGADVAVLPAVGHVPAEEVPDEIAALVVQVASQASSEVRDRRPEQHGFRL